MIALGLTATQVHAGGGFYNVCKDIELRNQTDLFAECPNTEGIYNTDMLPLDQIIFYQCMEGRVALVWKNNRVGIESNIKDHCNNIKLDGSLLKADCLSCYYDYNTNYKINISIDLNQEIGVDANGYFTFAGKGFSG